MIRLFAVLFVVFGCGSLLLGRYALPFQTSQDIGDGTLHVTGLHESERSGAMSFAYSRGDVSAQFPRSGAGNFAIDLRMGGLGGRLPVMAQIKAPSQSLALGPVKPIRVYHLLLPTDRHGDLAFRIQSTTARLESDPRELGVLLDWMRIRSLGATKPPLAGLVVALALALLLWALNRYFAPSLRLAARLVILWRVALWLIGAAGLWYSRRLYGMGKALTHHGEIVERNELLWKALIGSWARWDSLHYQTIALSGYSFAGETYPNIAFFPLYPLLIRAFLPLSRGSVVVAALIVAHLALLCALTLLSDLLARDFPHAIARRTLWLLLIFPTSLFFGAAYSESLALALLAAALWAIRARRWWLAGVAGCLLALTRLPGVMIAPVLLVAYLQDCGWRWRGMRPAVLAVVLPPAGLAGFMLFQWWRFGTPLAFLIAQRSWENRLSLPWVMPGVLLQSMQSSAEWPMAVFQAITWIAFLGLTLLAVRRLPLPYGLALVLLLLPPYLSNFPWSLPRHVLLGVPAFVLLATLADQAWIRRVIVGVTLPLLILATLLFVNGFWVA